MPELGRKKMWKEHFGVSKTGICYWCKNILELNGEWQIGYVICRGVSSTHLVCRRWCKVSAKKLVDYRI